MQFTFFRFMFFALLVPLGIFAVPLQNTSVYSMAPAKLELHPAPAETLLVNSGLSAREVGGCRRLRVLGVRIRTCAVHMVSGEYTSRAHYAEDLGRPAGTNHASAEPSASSC